MTARIDVSCLLRWAALAGLSVAMIGCQSFREATGAAKIAPDEFTVMTKAPLIVPPDFNLRPPQPGAPDRNLGSPTDMARAALFQQDPVTASAALEGDFSAGERAFLAQSGASVADPAVRAQIGADSGLTDQGQDFAREVLFPDGAAPQIGGTQ